MNLISNSLKFTMEGEIKVKVNYSEVGSKVFKLGSSSPRSEVTKMKHFSANKEKQSSFNSKDKAHIQSARILTLSAVRVKEDEQ